MKICAICGAKKIRNHKSEIINQTHHGKERNLEQGIASNHHGANGDSNHLRGDIVHGHVNRNVYTPVPHNRSLGRKRIRNRIEMGVRNVPPSGKSVYRI